MSLRANTAQMRYIPQTSKGPLGSQSRGPDAPLSLNNRIVFFSFDKCVCINSSQARGGGGGAVGQVTAANETQILSGWQEVPLPVLQLGHSGSLNPEIMD